MALGTSDISDHVNAAMITLARESRGLTQVAAAKRLGVSQARLSKVEAGLSRVTDDLLDVMVKGFHYPEQFFMQADKVLGPGTSEFFHRKKQSLSVRRLRQIHADINIKIMHIARLVRAVDIDHDELPRMDPEEYGSAEGVARAVRALWQVPPGPVSHVVSLIEDRGGIVIPCDFGTREIDALGRYVPGLPRMFFLNDRLPPDRQRLTLAHELGHAIMHQVPYPEMETEAYQFGAEFLMPAADIKRQFGHVDLPKLADLKPYWKVSMQALLMRARDLGKVTPRMERYLWMQLGKSGYRTCEPDMGIPHEKPTLLDALVEFHQDELGYGLTELSETLALFEDEAQATYKIGPSRGGLRRQIRAIK